MWLYFLNNLKMGVSDSTHQVVVGFADPMKSKWSLKSTYPDPNKSRWIVKERTVETND